MFHCLLLGSAGGGRSGVSDLVHRDMSYFTDSLVLRQGRQVCCKLLLQSILYYNFLLAISRLQV